MDNPRNAPPSQPSAQPASVRLPDDIVRKQQALRRHLQDPSSPAVDDPVRAAELAGFLLKGRSSGHPGASKLPRLFRNSLSIRDAVHDAASRKTSAIEKLRRRISDGMDATKIVTAWDRDGVRRSVAVPDQVARREWGQLSALIENLFPGKGGDPRGDLLPHEAARAEEFERLRAARVEDKVARLSPAERYLVSHSLLKLNSLRERYRKRVIEAKLGKPIEEFEKEVEQEVDVEVKRLMSDLTIDVSQGGHPNEGSSND